MSIEDLITDMEIDASVERAVFDAEARYALRMYQVPSAPARCSAFRRAGVFLYARRRRRLLLAAIGLAAGYLLRTLL